MRMLTLSLLFLIGCTSPTAPELPFDEQVVCPVDGVCEELDRLRADSYHCWAHYVWEDGIVYHCKKTGAS